MSIDRWNKRVRELGASAACVAALGFGAITGTTQAQQIPADGLHGLPAEQVVEIFWVCDYVATTIGMEATPVGLCSAAFQAVQETGFGGDFNSLLEWWRQMKPQEHARLASAERPRLSLSAN